MCVCAVTESRETHVRAGLREPAPFDVAGMSSSSHADFFRGSDLAFPVHAREASEAAVWLLTLLVLTERCASNTPSRLHSHENNRVVLIITGGLGCGEVTAISLKCVALTSAAKNEVPLRRKSGLN